MALEIYDKFDPVRYSELECEFLIKHLGEPPIVALQEIPPSVSLTSVREEVERVYALMEMEKARGTKWIGVEECKRLLQLYIDQVRKWREDWVRTRGKAPMFPSMYSYDSKGRPHRGGVGSDSGVVKTYFDKTGNRLPFAQDIAPSGFDDSWTPEWANNEGTDLPKQGLKVDALNSRIECLVCGHTEKYNTESRSSYNAARGRISKHLRTAKDNVDDHRAVQTNEFGS